MGYKVLVAEDEVLVAKQIAKMLKSMGHEVVAEVTSGREALRQVCSARPDVVLMDIQMPDGDGVWAAGEINKCCSTPVVIITAHDSNDLISKTSAAGVGAYLTKPPRSDEINRAINIAIARHRDFVEIKTLSEKLSRANEEKDRVIAELKDALDSVETLNGLMPICSSCRKVRDDKGYWKMIESFISERADVQFTQGMCPECERKAETDAPQHPAKPLSPREKEVLGYIKEGKSTWDISKLMGISENTVRFHVTSILRKLNAVTRAQAVASALQMGLI